MHWEKSVGVSYRKGKGGKGREEAEYWPESWVSKLSDLHLPHKCSCRLTGRRGANTAHTHRHTHTYKHTHVCICNCKECEREGAQHDILSHAFISIHACAVFAFPDPFILFVLRLQLTLSRVLTGLTQSSLLSVLCSLFDICIIFLHHLNISNFCSQFLWRRVVNHVHRQLSALRTRASDDDVIRIAYSYKNDTMSVHTHTHRHTHKHILVYAYLLSYLSVHVHLPLSLPGCSSASFSVCSLCLYCATYLPKTKRLRFKSEFTGVGSTRIVP